MKIVIEFGSMQEVREFATEITGGQLLPTNLVSDNKLPVPEEAPAETQTPIVTTAPKKRKTRAKKAETAPEPVAVPSLDDLIPVLKEHASKHGAGTVREALTALGASKLSQLDEAGRASLVNTLGL